MNLKLTEIQGEISQTPSPFRQEVPATINQPVLTRDLYLTVFSHCSLSQQVAGGNSVLSVSHAESRQSLKPL